MDAVEKTEVVLYDAVPIESVTQQSSAEEAMPTLPLAVVAAPIEIAPERGESAVNEAICAQTSRDSSEIVEKEAEALQHICFQALQAMLIATDCAYSNYAAPRSVHWPTGCTAA